MKFLAMEPAPARRLNEQVRLDGFLGDRNQDSSAVTGIRGTSCFWRQLSMFEPDHLLHDPMHALSNITKNFFAWIEPGTVRKTKKYNRANAMADRAWGKPWAVNRWVERLCFADTFRDECDKMCVMHAHLSLL